MAFNLPNSALKNLRRWFEEDWRTPKGKKGYSKGDSGIFRPTKKVSSKTPKTASEMSSAEKRSKIAEKKRLGQPAGKPRRVKSLKRRK